MVGYTCLDLSAPEYVEYDPQDDNIADGSFGKTLANAAMATCFFTLVCLYMVHTKLWIRLVNRVDLQERSGAEPRRSGFEDSKKKTFGVVFAWFLLAVELGVALVLYFRGEGRISGRMLGGDPEYPLLPDEDVCVIGGGMQLVSYATFYRCGVDVISQLMLWGLGEGLELPERTFVKAMVVCVNRCTGVESWSENFDHKSQWSGYLMMAISLHMLWPLIVDVLALCVFGTTGYTQFLFCVALGLTLCTCNCSGTLAPGEGGLLFVIDAVFNGVLGTAANVVQSGYVLGAVFVVLPTFEIVYSVAELFVVMNTATLP